MYVLQTTLKMFEFFAIFLVQKDLKGMNVAEGVPQVNSRLFNKNIDLPLNQLFHHLIIDHLVFMEFKTPVFTTPCKLLRKKSTFH